MLFCRKAEVLFLKVEDFPDPKISWGSVKVGDNRTTDAGRAPMGDLMDADPW